MDQEMLYGTVTAIVFQNTENGYTVLKLRSQDGDMVTVVGSIPMTVVGERLSITLAKNRINRAPERLGKAKVEVDIFELLRDSEYETAETST